jgi:transposase
MNDQSRDRLMTNPTASVEIVTRSERRRFGADEKLAIIRETLAPGASVGAVARRHGISPNLLYTWRKRTLSGAMAGFVPVAVSDERPVLSVGEHEAEASGIAVASGTSRRADGSELIEVALPNGWRVRIGNAAEAGALRRVFSALAALS